MLGRVAAALAPSPIVGLLSGCSVWGFQSRGLSCCKAWALLYESFSSCSTWAQQLRHPGSSAQAQQLRCTGCVHQWGPPGSGIELCLLHWQEDSAPLSYQGSPRLSQKDHTIVLSGLEGTGHGLRSSGKPEKNMGCHGVISRVWWWRILPVAATVQQDVLQWWKCSLLVLSNAVMANQMWVLNTWNVTNVTELNFKFLFLKYSFIWLCWVLVVAWRISYLPCGMHDL